MKKSKKKAKSRNRKIQKISSAPNSINEQETFPATEEKNREEVGILEKAETITADLNLSGGEAVITDAASLGIIEDELMKKRDLGEKSLSAALEPVFPERKKVKVLPIILGITVVLAALIFGIIYLYQKGYYNDRWYQDTKINDVDVSGQTLEESRALILEKMGNYALVIKGRNNGSMTINGDDIDFNFSFTDDFDALFNKQHKSFSLFPKKKYYSTEFDISFDQKKLRKLIKSSVFVKGDFSYPIIMPKSATVQFSQEKERYECVKEVLGNKLITSSFIDVVKNTIEKGKINLDIADEETYPDIYRNPKVTSDDPDLKKKVKALNYTGLRYIIWNMGKGVTEQITPTELSEWSTYEDGEVTFDEEKIKEWVENFCKKYKTTDKDREFKTHNNKIITVKAGDYGWQIDYEKALNQAMTAINKKIRKKDIKAYLKDSSEENKKPLTFRKKVPYANTAFRKDYEDYMYDWDPDNYTEISLKEQMVYVIREGKVAFSCRCISGRPTPERSTKPGVFFVKEHQPSRVLVGDDYRTPVTNWVRITWTGTGFHSANWQRWGSWSPDYYKTRGSHGCLNLSTEDSKTIYEMVKYKEAVFIY